MTPQEKLLAAIKNGIHNGREIPGHLERSSRKSTQGQHVKVVDHARSSIELQILKLAASGEVPPEQLIKIYPNISELRLYLVNTRDTYWDHNREFAEQVQDLLVLRMATIPGWD